MNNHFYQDITAANRDELKALFTQLHLAIVANKSNIAVSFPHYRFCPTQRTGSVGMVLRVFASSQDQLNKLRLKERAVTLGIDAVFAPSLPTPREVLGHAVFSRAPRRDSSSQRRSARRAVNQGKFTTIDEALAQIKANQGTSLPCVFAHSLSTGKDFPICLRVTPAPAPVAGDFTTYGLSSTATVPVF